MFYVERYNPAVIDEITNRSKKQSASTFKCASFNNNVRFGFVNNFLKDY